MFCVERWQISNGGAQGFTRRKYLERSRGHLEFNESWGDAARREVYEETGLTIKNIRLLAVTNDVMELDARHYVSIWMEADWEHGEAKIMEPQKCAKIEWHDFSSLPSPLFEPCWQNLRTTKPELFI